MTSLNFLCYVFSTCLIISSTIVIVSSHPVYSLLALVSSFIFSACILFLLECEFLALLFIIVYVGAISVLFLFVVMMLEPKMLNLYRNKTEYFRVSLIFGLFLVFPVWYQINRITFIVPFKRIIDAENGFHPKYTQSLVDKPPGSSSFYVNNYRNWYDLIDSTYDINIYGQVLYSYYILQFLIAGLILLLILIGVVYLTNSPEKQAKQQATFKQLSRKAKIFSEK